MPWWGVFLIIFFITVIILALVLTYNYNSNINKEVNKILQKSNINFKEKLKRIRKLYDDESRFNKPWYILKNYDKQRNATNECMNDTRVTDSSSYQNCMKSEIRNIENRNRIEYDSSNSSGLSINTSIGRFSSI